MPIGDFSPILAIPQTSNGVTFWIGNFAYLNAVIADWATMAVSMPDFTRFAKSQRAQAGGQIVMPFLMTAVAAVALMTTGATIYLGLNGGKGIIDPVILAAIFLPEQLKFFVLAAFMLAMFVVNVFANSIAPGYDIANTYSKYLTWFRGIVIGIIISAALGAWTFYASGAYGFIYNWLLAYGALLGGVEGVLIFDYAIIRRFKFEAVDAYLSHGRFRYAKGFNPAALISFAIGTIVTYLWYWKLVINPITQMLYVNSWISAFLITGVIYTLSMVIWIIPKYQPFLKGNITHGYFSEEVKALFKLGKDQN
jgi:Cytosine/uracil/thiamine/allantoin permeases